MLTAEQIDGLRIQADRLTSEMQDELLKNIARRISKAGQFTSTAAYETWKAQQLGLAREEIKREVRKQLRKSNAEIEKLFKQSAEVGYSFDLNNHTAAVPFEYNQSLQQLLSAAVEQATSDFDNLVRTAGMVIDGKALPLERAYIRAMDKAFMSVFTGVWDYKTAIQRSCRELADKGLVSIEYDSGKVSTLESAARRNIMGGLGLMQEKVSATTHDAIGADGWEISAHANSAPDHEDIQGKQYTDAEFRKLNSSLERPIGTLNCGHAAFPIILGVSRPQFTPDELEQMKRDNATGITYQGVHYSKYQATQVQRKLEASQRRQKRRIMMAKNCVEPDKKDIQIMEIRLRITQQEYVRFSKAAGLRLQPERAWVAKSIPKQSKTEEQISFERKYSLVNPEFSLYTESEKKKLFDEAKQYIKQHPESDLVHFAVNEVVHKYINVKGFAVKKQQHHAYILADVGSKEPYHIMSRMLERNISADEIQSFVDDAVFCVEQFKGTRKVYYSENGVTVLIKNKKVIDHEWIAKTAWKKEDWDDGIAELLKELKKIGLG